MAVDDFFEKFKLQALTLIPKKTGMRVNMWDYAMILTCYRFKMSSTERESHRSGKSPLPLEFSVHLSQSQSQSFH